MSTFVSVGNAVQPFARLLNAVASLADKGLLPAPVVVQHGATPFFSGSCEAIPFLEMKSFAQHVQSATVLILHAGAGSVIHASQAGKVPVIMPRRQQLCEHVDDHQLEFARMLQEAGKVVVVEKGEDLLRAIKLAQEMQVSSSAPGEPQMVQLIREALREIAATET